MTIYRQLSLTERSNRVLQGIRELAELLDLDRYADMDEAHAHEQKLFDLEARLEDELAAAPAESIDDQDPGPLLLFLQAYLLEGLYPDSVGNADEILSTCELLTLPLFTPRRMSVQRRTAIFHALRGKFGLSPIDAEPALNAAYVADCHLHLRRTLVDRLRDRFEQCTESAQPREALKGLFERFYPGHPLRAEDLDVVITRTALYWIVPDLDALAGDEAFQQRDEAEREAITAFLKTMGRFAFQYFSHFPTFSSFDVRDAEPALADELEQEINLPRHHVIELVNSSVSVERREVMEKYLLHDTWGHMWQGDLTRLGHLYDRMESLKAPLEALEPLDLDGNVVSLLDILYLDLQGHIQFDESLAEPFIEAWIRQRMNAMLAPVVAELTADMIEFKFRFDHPEDRDLLPSSSVFKHRPCKLDFAWVDLSYFAREVQRANRDYWQDPGLKENLVGRVCLLLQRKYPRQAAAADSKALHAEVQETVGAFMERLRIRQHDALETTLDCEHGKLNAFGQVLFKLLQVQCTLNRLVARLVDEELADYYVIVCIFAVLYFEQDPGGRFWTLDEAIAEMALPMIREIAKVEALVPE